LKTDSLFYKIFQTSPDIFFELIGNPFPRASTYGFASQEVKQTSFRLDGILLPPPYAANLPIYFVEVMGYRDRQEDLYPSFFSEIFLYLNDYLPVNDWRAVLIFTQRRFDPGLSIHYLDFDNATRLQRIYLDELSEKVVDRSLGLGILHLIGVKAEIAPQRARQLVERAMREVKDDAAFRQVIELLETVCIYKFPNLEIEEVEAMLGLSELKQTRFYQQAFQEGESAIVWQQLTHRLGNLSPDLQSQIRQLSASQLEDLAEVLLDFSTKEDLVAWLQRR
jgi:predicted transposase YdaD